MSCQNEYDFLLCDFETSADCWVKSQKYPNAPDDVARVWCWGIYDWLTKIYYFGHTIDEFFERIFELKRDSKHYPKCFFHNLSHDGSYILNYFDRLGIKHSKVPEENTYTTKINDMKQWYYVQYTLRKYDKSTVKIRFDDSFKKIRLKLSQFAEYFGLGDDFKKLEIDYNKYRPEHEPLNRTDLVYQHMDCKALGQAIELQYRDGFKGLTVTSDSFKMMKASIPNYDVLFPKLGYGVDGMFRPGLFGGAVVENTRYRNKEVGHGFGFDWNSLYPWIAMSKPLPYGAPIYCTGYLKKRDLYPLRFHHCYARFKVKDDYLPTVRTSRSIRNHSNLMYYEDTTDKEVELFLWDSDIELLHQHYDVSYIDFVDGFYLKTATGIFYDFFDYHRRIKERPPDKAARQNAKSASNNSIGKTTQNPKHTDAEPYFDDYGILRFTICDSTYDDGQYIPFGSNVTALGRFELFTNAQKLMPYNFIYGDTDSLKILGDTVPDWLAVDDVEYGKLKLENTFDWFKLIGPKTYAFNDVNTGFEACCAGANSFVTNSMTRETFQRGAIFNGNLKRIMMPGGYVLRETTFELK